MEIPEHREETLTCDGALWSVRWAQYPEGNATWGRTIYEICAWLNYEAAIVGERQPN